MSQQTLSKYLDLQDLLKNKFLSHDRKQKHPSLPHLRLGWRDGYRHTLRIHTLSVNAVEVLSHSHSFTYRNNEE